MSSNRSILLVEDDRDLLAIMKRFLESEGFRVSGAASAEEAYDLLAAGVFSLLVLDVNLPGEDGIELCRRLRKASSTPVIFASARIEGDARAVALESGGDAYLSKPFSLRELLAQVNAVLARFDFGVSSNTSSNASSDGNEGVYLDARSRRVYKNGTPVELSPKEYDLVAALMRSPGTAVSKNQLLADVWGAFSEVEPQTLAVHMSWIRAKLEDDPTHPAIFETIRGFGYRYNPTQGGESTERGGRNGRSGYSGVGDGNAEIREACSCGEENGARGA